MLCSVQCNPGYRTEHTHLYMCDLNNGEWSPSLPKTNQFPQCIMGEKRLEFYYLLFLELFNKTEIFWIGNFMLFYICIVFCIKNVSSCLSKRSNWYPVKCLLLFIISRFLYCTQCNLLVAYVIWLTVITLFSALLFFCTVFQ